MKFLSLLITVVILVANVASRESHFGADSMSNRSRERRYSNVWQTDAHRLFEHLMEGYQKLVRPMEDPLRALKIQFKFKLQQIMDMHEKVQVLSTAGWLIHIWNDYRLAWNVEEFGGIKVMYIPAEMLWLPDIILYNNAHGKPQVTTAIKARVYPSGTVMWEPPVTYNSLCQIDVQWFPFDEQDCRMKFGSWSYTGWEVDMMHLMTDTVIKQFSDIGEEELFVDVAIDLSDYQESVEWDLMKVNGIKHSRNYACCDYPYIDITYYLNLRRKRLFYFVNLIIPCIAITMLTVMVFYLPSDSNNKITMCVSILVSITVFFLLLIEIIPPTSLTIPLIGRYLVFTMTMITLSVCCTVLTLNVHYRTGEVSMPVWFRRVFVVWAPKLFYIHRRPRTDIEHRLNEHRFLVDPPVVPAQEEQATGERRSPLLCRRLDYMRNSRVGDTNSLNNKVTGTLNADVAMIRRDVEPDLIAFQPSSNDFGSNLHFNSLTPPSRRRANQRTTETLSEMMFGKRPPTELTPKLTVELLKQRACRNVTYIAQYICAQRKNNDLRDDWRFAAMVIDRILFVIFALTIFIGTMWIIVYAPWVGDKRLPITSAARKLAEAVTEKSNSSSKP